MYANCNILLSGIQSYFRVPVRLAKQRLNLLCSLAVTGSYHCLLSRLNLGWRSSELERLPVWLGSYFTYSVTLKRQSRREFNLDLLYLLRHFTTMYFPVYATYWENDTGSTCENVLSISLSHLSRTRSLFSKITNNKVA